MKDVVVRCFFFFSFFKSYMSQDVASPLPPSGLRSLPAVCVPLMHSHSLACSCKTSRDLFQVSTSSNISVDTVVFVSFLFFSFLLFFCFSHYANPLPAYTREVDDEVHDLNLSFVIDANLILTLALIVHREYDQLNGVSVELSLVTTYISSKQ